MRLYLLSDLYGSLQEGILIAAYYNEHDAFAAQWLRNLITAGLIAPGEVDERDIQDVRPSDLAGFNQCHFFAGIGGWSRALRLAGVPDDESIWTGSCPCQPFSAAGRNKGKADARHLWPVWAGLIRECRPARIFGEQVSSAIAHGWLDEAAHDMEAAGYAVAAAVLPACSVGVPHRRDRLWFVADAGGSGSLSSPHAGVREREESARPRHEQPERCGSALADALRSERWPAAEERNELDGAETGRQEAAGGYQLHRQEPMADANKPRLEEWAGINGHNGTERAATERGSVLEHANINRCTPRSEATATMGYGRSLDATDWILCGDGKRRPIEPSIRLLAHAIPNRVGKLRGLGNAIVPTVAAGFIKAFLEVA